MTSNSAERLRDHLSVDTLAEFASEHHKHYGYANGSCFTGPFPMPTRHCDAYLLAVKARELLESAGELLEREAETGPHPGASAAGSSQPIGTGCPCGRSPDPGVCSGCLLLPHSHCKCAHDEDATGGVRA